MSALIVSAVVREIEPGLFDIAVTEPAYKVRRQRHAKKWGVGTAITIRIEPEDEAVAHGQRKHYFGALVKPVSEFTGYTVHEIHAEFKALFMPDGKTSITQLSYDEMRDFIEQVELHIQEQVPEALAA